MEFVRVDARDDALFAAWFEILFRSERARDPDPRGAWRPEEWRARALDDRSPAYHELFGWGEGSFVAVGALEVTRSDNLDWIRAELFVDPTSRREGHGTATLAHLEARARELGRRMIVVHVDEGAKPGASPSRQFAPRRGYEVAEENITRELAWPTTHGALDALELRCAAAHRDYEIRSWTSEAPGALLGGFAALRSVMPLEVPAAGLPVEAERWDDERLRRHERRVHEMGRDLLVSLARHRTSGEVVGFSELTVSRDAPETAYQWDTLVRRDHRGHRLGTALKLATLRRLEAGAYRTQRIVTSNNSLNLPMIAVNEQMGFRPTSTSVTWRKQLV